MKKIYLNDRFCLTAKFLMGEISLVVDDVLDAAEGRESVDRDGRYFVFPDGEKWHTRFAEGDSVVVKTSYEKAGLDKRVYGDSKGWRNRRCTNEKYLPYRMVVEGVRCVRVQDLTEEEMLRAGVHRGGNSSYMVGGEIGGWSADCKEMFARMFNAWSKVPWEENPWVIVYDVTPVGVGLARSL